MEFTKADLKVGMVVEIEREYEDKDIYLAMVLPSKTTEKCLSGEDDWFPVCSISDDLTHGNAKITKVYDICKNNRNAHKISTLDRELIWKREEYTITESEKKVLELLQYPWIARDEDGTLCAYSAKPIKSDCEYNHIWEYNSETEEQAKENMEDAIMLCNPYGYGNGAFPIKLDFITWEDNEPWHKDDLLKLKVRG
jgi:hypothetical protein